MERKKERRRGSATYKTKRPWACLRPKPTRGCGRYKRERLKVSLDRWQSKPPAGGPAAHAESRDIEAGERGVGPGPKKKEDEKEKGGCKMMKGGTADNSPSESLLETRGGWGVSGGLLSEDTVLSLPKEAWM